MMTTQTDSVAAARSLAAANEGAASLAMLIRLADGDKDGDKDGDADGDGDLQYLTGAMALQQGDVGRAVHHLRRAVHVTPWRRDLKQSYALALKTRADSLAGGEPWLLRVDPLVLSLGAALFALMFVLASLAKLKARWVRPMLAAFTVLMLIGSCANSWWQRRPWVTVITDVDGKDGPAGATIMTAHAGLWGESLQQEGDRTWVRFENGVEAWVLSSSLAVAKR